MSATVLLPHDPLSSYGQQAFASFRPDEALRALIPLGKGLVNATWLAQCQGGSNYVLQRLNPAIFPKPALVQSNLCRLTAHLRHTLPAESNLQVVQVCQSPTGETTWPDLSGACWRVLTYLEGTKALESISSPEQARSIGAALGQYHQCLASLPRPPLAETLPGFHNTPLYLARYDALLPQAKSAEDAACHEFISQRRAEMHLLEDARSQGTITVQAVHGDPKVGNFLFSLDGQQVISLVDWDTAQFGLLLHDLGDCLRSCCNPLGEEPFAGEQISFRSDLFTAVLEGYIAHAAGLLQANDWCLLVDSARVISLELGLRFYSDYLAGNPYFNVAYLEQNLVRARVQFALVRSIEDQYRELIARVQCYQSTEREP